MPREIVEQPPQNRHEAWLESGDRKLVEAAAVNDLVAVIDALLKKISPDFSPEECADIIASVLEKAGKRDEIIPFVRTLQSSNE